MRYKIYVYDYYFIFILNWIGYKFLLYFMIGFVSLFFLVQVVSVQNKAED